MRKLAIVLVVTLGVIGLGVVLAIRSFNAAITQVGSPIHSGTRMTLAQFEQIKTGMTYAEVVKIVGGPGRELSQSEAAGIKTIMYAWDGDGGLGANANLMFQNDKVVTKAQFGLASNGGNWGAGQPAASVPKAPATQALAPAGTASPSKSLGIPRAQIQSKFEASGLGLTFVMRQPMNGRPLSSCIDSKRGVVVMLIGQEEDLSEARLILNTQQAANSDTAEFQTLMGAQFLRAAFPATNDAELAGWLQTSMKSIANDARAADLTIGGAVVHAEKGQVGGTKWLVSITIKPASLALKPANPALKPAPVSEKPPEDTATSAPLPPAKKALGVTRQQMIDAFKPLGFNAGTPSVSPLRENYSQEKVELSPSKLSFGLSVELVGPPEDLWIIRVKYIDLFGKSVPEESDFPEFRAKMGKVLLDTVLADWKEGASWFADNQVLVMPSTESRTLEVKQGARWITMQDSCVKGLSSGNPKMNCKEIVVQIPQPDIDERNRAVSPK